MITKVKSHTREGRVVRSHSRTTKGAMKNVAGMSKEECKAKYDAIVGKFGANSPQAKKIAEKMEAMETVEKDSKLKKGTLYKTAKGGTNKGRVSNGMEYDTDNKPTKFIKGKKIKKHSRGEYMRRNVDEELLTKESRKKGSKISSDVVKANGKEARKKLFADKTVVGKKPSTEHKMAMLRAKRKK